MRNSYRLARVMGIDINIHVTFLLLLALFFFLLGPSGLFLVVGVFFFVTVHEICHSLAAAYFGIKVKTITLLPIGGVAAMPEMPTKPYQELIISLAGPLSNVIVVILFYYPLRAVLGAEALMYPLRVMSGQAEYTGQFNVLAHIYWINLVLAVFNMIPAFPMDGGRVLRAALSYRLGRKEATRVAVRLGHIFALLFAYFGIVHGHIFLLIIAVFIYMSASGEGMQVMVQETIKRYRVEDVLSRDFVHVTPETPIKKVLELIFHSHREDFAVMDNGLLKGIITRKEVMRGMHSVGQEAPVKNVMRADIPPVKATATLEVARKLMQRYNSHALPVINKERVVGLVTMDDINRVFMMVSE
jgi:Zn-dependent protease/CBS domain-containing protein